MAAEFKPPGKGAGTWLTSKGLGAFAAPAAEVIDLSVAAGAAAEVTQVFSRLKSLHRHVDLQDYEKVMDTFRKVCKALVDLRAKTGVRSPLHTKVTESLTAVFKIMTDKVAARLAPADDNGSGYASDGSAASTASAGSDESFRRAYWVPKYAPWISAMHTALVEGDIGNIDGWFAYTDDEHRFVLYGTEFRWALSMWNIISECPRPPPPAQRDVPSQQYTMALVNSSGARWD